MGSALKAYFLKIRWKKGQMLFSCQKMLTFIYDFSGKSFWSSAAKTRKKIDKINRNRQPIAHCTDGPINLI